MNIDRLTRLAYCGIVIAQLMACTAESVPTGGAPDADGLHQAGPTSANPGRPTGGENLAPPPEAAAPVPPAFRPDQAAAGRAGSGLGGLGQAQSGPGDPGLGRSFALDNCRPCHVVARDQASATRFANAPSFPAIANMAGTTPLGLSVWLTNPHPTMPSLILSPDEASNVIAYILSLRGKS